MMQEHELFNIGKRANQCKLAFQIVVGREPDLMEFFTPHLQAELPDLTLTGIQPVTESLSSANPFLAFDLYRHNRAWDGFTDNSVQPSKPVGWLGHAGPVSSAQDIMQQRGWLWKLYRTSSIRVADFENCTGHHATIWLTLKTVQGIMQQHGWLSKLYRESCNNMADFENCTGHHATMWLTFKTVQGIMQQHGWLSKLYRESCNMADFQNCTGHHATTWLTFKSVLQI